MLGLDIFVGDLKMAGGFDHVEKLVLDLIPFPIDI